MNYARMNDDITGENVKGSDTLRGYDHRRFSNSREYARLVRKAAHYYDSMAELRRKFKRDLDYYMGRQLNDTVVYNGCTMSVHDYMELKGMPALSSDIITDKMISLKGLVRSQYMAPTVKAVDSEESAYAGLFSEMLRQNDNNNDKAEHNAAQFEAHADMGFIVDKVQWTFRNGREDVYVDQIDPFKIAVPVFYKKDLSDVEFIAEAHDLTWPQLVSVFAHSSRDEKELEEIYTGARTSTPLQGYGDTGMNQTGHLDDFYHSSVVGKYRVIEIWTLERNRALWCHDRLNATAGFRPLSDKADIDAENARRMADNIRKDEFGVPVLDMEGNEQYYIAPDEVELIEYEQRIEDIWYFRFLSPTGYLLHEGISPYRVVRNGFSFYYHPYVFLAYPCLQGEIRSYVDRLIDKQRQYNHDNILLDFIIMNSSKGALAIDEEALSEKMSMEDIAENYVKVDGVILYTSKKGGNIPTSIQNKSIPAGIDLIIQRDRELLTSQSGIQPAMQGVHHNSSGKQYQIEREASATSVADYISAFNNFVLRVARKQLWTMQGHYTSRHSIMLTGQDIRQYYNPETMQDVDFDLTLTMDANSAVIREQMKDLAFQAYQRQEIDFGQMLTVADFGDTARLKRAWEEHKAEMQSLSPTLSKGEEAKGVGGSRPEEGANRLVQPSDTGGGMLVGTPGTSS